MQPMSSASLSKIPATSRKMVVVSEERVQEVLYKWHRENATHPHPGVLDLDYLVAQTGLSVKEIEIRIDGITSEIIEWCDQLPRNFHFTVSYQKELAKLYHTDEKTISTFAKSQKIKKQKNLVLGLLNNTGSEEGERVKKTFQDIFNSATQESPPQTTNKRKKPLTPESSNATPVPPTARTPSLSSNTLEVRALETEAALEESVSEEEPAPKKQKRLSEETIDQIIGKWHLEHASSPRPTDGDMTRLVQATNLSRQEIDRRIKAITLEVIAWCQISKDNTRFTLTGKKELARIYHVDLDTIKYFAQSSTIKAFANIKLALLNDTGMEEGETTKQNFINDRSNPVVASDISSDPIQTVPALEMVVTNTPPASRTPSPQGELPTVPVPVAAASATDRRASSEASSGEMPMSTTTTSTAAVSIPKPPVTMASSGTFTVGCAELQSLDVMEEILGPYKSSFMACAAATNALIENFHQFKSHLNEAMLTPLYSLPEVGAVMKDNTRRIKNGQMPSFLPEEVQEHLKYLTYLSGGLRSLKLLHNNCHVVQIPNDQQVRNLMQVAPPAPPMPSAPSVVPVFVPRASSSGQSGDFVPVVVSRVANPVLRNASSG